MARDGFQTETRAIEEMILQMAAFVEELIARALHAMTHGDDRLGEEVIATDRIVDDLRRQVHQNAMQTIEHWAPMGPALRRVITYISIADELERIGDYAVHVARGARAGYRAMPLELVGDMGELAKLVRQQVRDGVQALGLVDVDAARRVCSRDNGVDECYHTLFTALQTYMRAAPETVQETTQLLFVMHDLERIADRMANICEDVIYIVTGTYEKLN
jgi:phosphate transport system protein